MHYGASPKIFELAELLRGRMTEAEKILHDEYKDNMSIEQGIKLAAKALKTALDSNFDNNRIDCVYIKSDDQKYTRLNQDDLKKVLDDAKKK